MIFVIGANMARRGSVFEPAGFAGEFAGAVGERRRSADRKSFVPNLEFLSYLFFILNTSIPIDIRGIL